jgi:ribosome-binding protein aMBF1 (putative translation factor)
MIDRDRMDLFDPMELSKDPTYRAAINAQWASILLMEMREAAGLSREQLASQLGRSPAEIEFFERGKSPDGPPMGLILRVAELCGASLTVRYKDPMKQNHVIGVEGL